MWIDVVSWLLVFVYCQFVKLSGREYAEFFLELIYPVEFPRLLRFPITQLLLSGCFQIALENDFQLGRLFSYVSNWSNWYVPLNQGPSSPEDFIFSNPSFEMLMLRYGHSEKTMKRKDGENKCRVKNVFSNFLNSHLDILLVCTFSFVCQYNPSPQILLQL